MRWWLMAVGGMMLAACSQTQFVVHTVKRIANATEEPAPSAAEARRSKGTYKVGNPYEVAGVWYYPVEDWNYDETGIASWYGSKFHGRATANGEIYDMNLLTAAHKSLPMPSLVHVTNLENGRGLILRVNDRGPFVHGRIIDLSRRSAQLLGFEQQGTAKVRVRILGKESRALAVRMRGDAELASLGTPITVPSLPKAPVSSEALPPPRGASEAPIPGWVAAPAPEVAPAPRGNPLNAAEKQIEYGIVSQEAVGPTDIFVQAGAYSVFENANKVHATLLALGPVRITSVLIGGRDLFRVRVGPLRDVDYADLILERVIISGFPDARIIID